MYKLLRTRVCNDDSIFSCPFRALAIVYAIVMVMGRFFIVSGPILSY